MNLAKEMPGVKANGVREVRQITEEQWLAGKEAEEYNFYLQQLKNHRRAAGWAAQQRQRRTKLVSPCP
jgi:hypothetical protein